MPYDEIDYRRGPAPLPYHDGIDPGDPSIERYSAMARRALGVPDWPSCKLAPKGTANHEH